MSDQTPDLANKPQKWYQGLSRYQWWVLIIASMGWMFDTMDQQFFNLGRGPAMKAVLHVDPIAPGLEKLGEEAPSEFDAAALDALVANGSLPALDKTKLLTNRKGEPVETATRKDVAKAIGNIILTPKFVEMGKPELPRKLGSVIMAEKLGKASLAEAKVEGDAFDKTALEKMAEKGQITYTVAADIIEDKQLEKEQNSDVTVSIEQLTLYVGKYILLEQPEFTKSDLEGLVTDGLLTTEQVTQLLGDTPDAPVAAADVLEAVGQETTTSTDNFDKQILDRLAILDAISPGAAAGLLKDHGNQSVPKGALTKYFGQEFANAEADRTGDLATTIFIFGWAFGGLFFGWVGDSLGRAKTMAITILTYSIFTGLNGLAQTEMQFHILRLLTAFGVGGEFAAGAALVAESMPDRSRPAALGALQALSAIGNMMGAALAFFIMPTWGWRWLFAVGAIPGLVAVFVFLKLKEPEKWKEARRKWLEERAAGITHKRSSYLGILSEPKWAMRALIGMLLGVVGVGGLWGVGFFTPELNRLIAKNYSEEAKEQFVAVAFFLQQFGAFLGISAYTWVSLTMGRKPAFGVFFVLAFFIVSYTFLAADTIVEAYVLAPLVGFVTLGPFGGFAIYFPELFPTRLRATGVGICYNVGRFLAALVPQFKGALKGLLMSGAFMIPFLPAVAGSAERAIRYGSFLMIFIYIFGLIVLLFAPETKGQPLPED
jgi:predicted MFS family arabinose efflux permease